MFKITCSKDTHAARISVTSHFPLKVLDVNNCVKQTMISALKKVKDKKNVCLGGGVSETETSTGAHTVCSADAYKMEDEKTWRIRNIGTVVVEKQYPFPWIYFLKLIPWKSLKSEGSQERYIHTFFKAYMTVMDFGSVKN